MAVLDLSKIVSLWIKREGVEGVNEILKERLGKEYTPKAVEGWMDMKVDPPLAVAQIVVDTGRIEWSSPDNPFDGAKIYILNPIYRYPEPLMMKAVEILRYRYQADLGYLQEVGSSIDLARNKLADKFLATDAEWALWLDDDMAPPMGYPDEFKKWGAKIPEQFAGVDVLERLMSHKKTLVSATYFDRHGLGMPMFDEGRNRPEMQKQLQNGPSDRIYPTNWVGAGCCLVHRRVYEDILEKIPEVRSVKSNAPNSFYLPMKDAGEDASFALRAQASGHQPYVDFGCLSGHIGKFCFFNQKIK